MNQQSTIQQPDNILSLAQTWFRGGVQRTEQNQADNSTEKHPPNRALYERVKRISEQILQEKDDSFYSPE